jgi:hypothetical protein
MPKQYGYILMRDHKKIDKPLISGEEIPDLLYKMDAENWKSNADNYFKEAAAQVFLKDMADGEWHTIKIVREEIPENKTLLPGAGESDYGGEMVMIYIDHTEKSFLGDDRYRAECEQGKKILRNWEQKSDELAKG